MAEQNAIDVSNLKFRRDHPEKFADRFDEIQALRLKHYTKVFEEFNHTRLIEEHKRTPEEMAHFVGRLTLERWSDPMAGIGITARRGQDRFNPQAVIAFDAQTDEIKALFYTAENVSSWLEPRLNKLPLLPAKSAEAVGRHERNLKVKHGWHYVWSSEYAHAEEVADIVPVLGVLALETYDTSLKGSWFPWMEEKELRATIRPWRYDWNGHVPATISGEGVFGTATETVEELWVVSTINEAIQNIESSLAVKEAVSRARATLST